VFANVEPDKTKWSQDRYDIQPIDQMELEPHRGIGGVAFTGGKMKPHNPFKQTANGASKKRKREEEGMFYGVNK